MNAFADDILFIADDEADAKVLIQAIFELDTYGLRLHKDKTVILTDRKDLQGTEEIEGIKILKKIKYLGLQISCDRNTILKDAKATARRFLGYIKGKI